jgi:sortase (surface protein transpeptidase)
MKPFAFLRSVPPDRLAFSLIALLTLVTLAVCSLWPTSQEAKPAASPPGIEHTPYHTVVPSSNVHSAPSTARIVANPVHLIIPAIGVNAPIESVGILPNGNLATPIQHPWDNVGWYNLGPRPGQAGSAVIDGHLDRPGGVPAIFWRLRDQRSGDKVIVVDAQGKNLLFYVTRVASYAAQHIPIQEIFGNNTGFYLNLITCAGDWIPNQHQTTLRLVVYSTFGE